MEQSQIQEYYAEKCVFITGGTGFLGKLLLEKLLRSTTVEKIYLLIRRKEKKNADERLQELFKCPVRNSPMLINFGLFLLYFADF